MFEKVWEYLVSHPKADPNHLPLDVSAPPTKSSLAAQQGHTKKESVLSKMKINQPLRQGVRRPMSVAPKSMLGAHVEQRKRVSVGIRSCVAHD